MGVRWRGGLRFRRQCHLPHHNEPRRHFPMCTQRAKDAVQMNDQDRSPVQFALTGLSGKASGIGSTVAQNRSSSATIRWRNFELAHYLVLARVETYIRFAIDPMGMGFAKTAHQS